MNTTLAHQDTMLALVGKRETFRGRTGAVAVETITALYADLTVGDVIVRDAVNASGNLDGFMEFEIVSNERTEWIDTHNRTFTTVPARNLATGEVSDIRYHATTGIAAKLITA